MTLMKLVDSATVLNNAIRFNKRDHTVAGFVTEILKRVLDFGDQALLDYTLQFDGIALASIHVPLEAIQSAAKRLDRSTRTLLESAIQNIKRFHMLQKQSSWMINEEDGTVLGEKVTPLDRVGIYVPGGKAFYPSTMIMNTVPALIADVPSITIASPPGKDGLPHELVLALCSMLGLNDIISVGGAHAIAAMAYGTETIKPVCKITGPGNKFVAEAKRQVFGTIGIDSIAGPSEIVILHDNLEIPVEFLVRDLLTQAEHDEDATAILITTSLVVARQVRERIDQLVPTLPRRAIIEQSLTNNGKIIHVETVAEGVELVNRLAPEHLELMVGERAILDQIKNAGAIFIGQWSTETIGDYFAGPNHTIPTSGAAKYGSPLSVRDFQKHTSIIEYSQTRLNKEAKAISDFATLEGLIAHAEAIRIRQS